jgi:hypothetical protein
MRRGNRVLAASLWLLALPSWSLAAAPQLFKCVDGGRTVYQQQACPVTSQAEPAASAAHGSAKVASEPAPRVTARLKPASPPASSGLATPR